MNTELLEMYLDEIKKIASTSRVGNVLVSPKRALEEVSFYVDEVLKCIKEN